MALFVHVQQGRELACAAPVRDALLPRVPVPVPVVVLALDLGPGHPREQDVPQAHGAPHRQQARGPHHHPAPSPLEVSQAQELRGALHPSRHGRSSSRHASLRAPAVPPAPPSWQLSSRSFSRRSWLSFSRRACRSGPILIPPVPLEKAWAWNRRFAKWDAQSSRVRYKKVCLERNQEILAITSSASSKLACTLCVSS